TEGAKLVGVPKSVIQFSPEWFEQRLMELRRDFGAEGRKLANRLEHAWHQGKLRALIVRAPEAGRTAEHVVVEDVSRQWNEHIGVQSTHTMPRDRRPRPITDPARLLSSGPTNAERGLEAAEKADAAELHALRAESSIPKPRPSTLEHLGEG